ncbi:MAG: Holliday junction resolvase RuvX [Anaerolineales bacterium]|nr:Holliday junction resolvase RuvX [Anaerolineales bacterium]
MCGRVMAVDPGDVRIGLAISDPSGTIAQPLKVIVHRSRAQDADAIIEEAKIHEVHKIVVGVPYDLEGEIGPQARKVLRLVDVLNEITELPIVLWDESGSSIQASEMSNSDSMLDARAAAVILQEFLDAERT